MYVMTIDQIGSRTRGDRVPELLAGLAGIPVLAPFERSVGDEVQGVPDGPESVLRVLIAVLRDGGWHCGLGAGAGELGVGDPPSARGGRGAAFLRAREAVEASKGEAVSLSVRDGGSIDARDLEALLHVFGVLASRRTPTQWGVIDAYEQAGSGTAAAQALDITPQAVSQSLASSAWREESAAHPLALRLIAALGATS